MTAVRLPAPPSFQSPTASALVATDERLLVIGAVGIAEKEQLVLRSLIRLLDRQQGLRLRFAERLADSHVIFASPSWVSPADSRQAIVVRVLAGPGDGEVGADAPVIVAPLRMSNVTALLRHCAAHQGGAEPANEPPAMAVGGLLALFQRLTHCALSADRASELLTLSDGRQLRVDYAHESIQTPVSQNELLDGRYQLVSAQPAPGPLSPGGPTLPLRELVWAAAYRLGADGTPGTDLPARYRLLRWPDAAALTRPGFPRLAALWNTRSLGVAEASAASGTDATSVRWFLGTCLSLGIAAPDHGPEPQAAAWSSALPTSSGAFRSALGRLRERFKLW